MQNKSNLKILICGVLPPPSFGHSKIYEMLMASSFPATFNVRFFNMHFWSYETNKKVTSEKIVKMVKYYGQYLRHILLFRPKYILYNISFYRMPFLKDFLFCATGIVLGRKMVFHDLGQYVGELDASLPNWQKAMLRWMLKNSAASIVMGERVKPVYKGLMPFEKLYAVPGVVEDTKDLEVQVTPNRDKNILYFSHMSTPKGVYVAFDIMPLVLNVDQNVRFTFAGPMESEEVAQKVKILEGQFPGRVEYLGYIEDINQRTAIFRNADIFLFPTMRDVFGLVLLHAMAEGLPVVASFEGTIPEIVIDQENGFLCQKGLASDFAARILQLLKNQQLTQKIGQANRKRFEEHYALKHYQEKMISVFVNLEGEAVAQN